MIVVETASRLARDADAVWAEIATPAGVNRELMPMLRMTFPPGASLRDVRADQMGEPLFVSWLLAFGILPFDRHVFALERLGGRAFSEYSHSLMQREWRHDRSVTPDGAGCIVRDRVRVTPRLPFAAAPTRWLVRRIFAHRHRRLRARFGD